MCIKWKTLRIKKIKFWIKKILITVSLSFNTHTHTHKKTVSLLPKKKGSCQILNVSFYLILLWVCNKWLNKQNL